MSRTIGELLVRVRSDTKDFMVGMRKAERELRKASRQFQTIGKDLMKLGAPFVAVGGMAIKMGLDFESSMNKINSLVGLSIDEVNKMKPAVKEMAASVGKDASEAADALFFITSAGLRGAEAMDTLEMSLKASAVGLGETKDIANLVTSTMMAYGSEVVSAQNATDILTTAIREGKLEASDLASVMGGVLPLASAMGVSFNEVGAAFAAMSRTGTPANEAATQLRGILNSLLSPAEKSRKVLEEYGLTAQGLREQIREEGLLATLETLTEKFGDNEEAVAQVFGNVRALTGVIDLMGKNVEGTREIFANMADTTGVLDTAFQSYSETTEAKLNKAIQTFKVLLVDIGEKLLPVFEIMLQKLQTLGNWITSIDSKTLANIITWGSYVAAAGAVVFVIGKIIGIGVTLIATITKISAGFVALKGAVLAVNAALLANPIGAIIAAVAALTAGIVWAIKKHDEWGAAILALMGPFGLIINAVKSVYDNWQSVKDAFTADGISGALKRLGIVLLDAVLKPLEQILSLASRLPGIGDLAGKAQERIHQLRQSLDLINDKPQTTGVDIADANPFKTFDIKRPGSGPAPFTPDEPEGGTGGGFSGVATSLERIATNSIQALEPINHLNESVFSLSDNSIDLSDNIKSITDNLREIPEASESVAESFDRMIDGLQGMIQNGNVLEATMAAATLSMVDSSMRGAASFQSLAASALDAGAKIIRSRIMEGVAGYVAQVLGSSPIGALLAPMAGIAATSIFNSILNKIQPPKLATGGLAFGETLATVGDNPNARVDPEVISPLSKLKDMMGGQTIKIEWPRSGFRLDGRDLALVVDQNQSILNRTR